MAERFNLTAQLQLQAPTNTGAVITQIRRQLKGIAVDVQVKSNVQTIAKTNKALQNVDKSARSSAKSVGQLNRNLSDAARRFSVITVATGTMLSLARAFKNSVGEAIAFERELVRISQVTGKSTKNLQGLTKEVTRLSTSLGASSKDLLSVSRVLAQAGFDADRTRKALDILAKTSLGATFNSIQDTAEGAIAVLRQFRKEARAAGGEIKFLEQTLDAINAVSKNFAVESGDLITVIRRVGGVFEAAGGKVNELIALFTSVRATTRESAETIATGLRTIFTRLQRTETIDQLRTLGIVLQDSQGQFVGAYEGVRRLSQGLAALDPRDFRFSQIVEQLGGFRQIGKVIPLIRQFTTAQDALNVAQGASGSVTRDAATAQQALAVQIAKVREDFDALIRKFADSSTFRSIATGALEVAKAFIRIADALEPILPLITSLAMVKIGKSLAPGLASIAGFGGGARGRAMGGRIHGFARGGFVPGTGNRDTVPAMLQPGEFVIRKSSAAKLGSSALEAMNNNRFKNGGAARPDPTLRQELDKLQGTKAYTGDKDITSGPKGKQDILKFKEKLAKAADKNVFAAAFLRPEARDQVLEGTLHPQELKTALEGIKGYAQVSKGPEGKQVNDIIKRVYNKENKFDLHAGSLESEKAEDLESTILDGIHKTVKKGTTYISKELLIQKPVNVAKALKSANIDQTVGNIFESIIEFTADKEGPKDRANAPFDFPAGLGKAAKAFGLEKLKKKQADAKTTFSKGNLGSFLGKVRNVTIEETEQELRPIIAELAASKKKPSLADSRALMGLGTKATVAEVEAAAEKRNLKFNKVGSAHYEFQKAAMGGKIDSVPALLTPGEFVVKKSSAQSIGYGNLNKMNQTGVQRFNSGGVVQRFEKGGSVGSGSDLVVPRFDYLTGKADTLAKQMDKITQNFIKQGLEGEELTQAQEIAAKELKAGSGKMKTAFEKGVVSVKGASLLPAAAPNKALAGNMSGTEHLKSMGADARLTAGSIKLFGNLLKKGMPAQKALEAATNKLAADQKKAIARRGGMSKAGVEYTKSLQGASTSLKNLRSRAAAALSKRAENMKTAMLGAPVKGKDGAPAGRAGGGMRGQVQQLDAMAGAAQQFVFVGGMAASLATQFSGMSEATKKATTETIGFATSLVGVGGTLIQTFTQMALAGRMAAQADSEEALASKAAAGKGAAGGGGGLAKTLGGIALAVVAVISVMKYWSSKAKAEADELGKSTEAALKNIKEGKGGSAETIKSDMQKEVALRSEAQGASTTNLVAAGGMAAAAGGMAAAAASAGVLGATLGSAVPVVGTVAGALAGLALGAWLYTRTSNEAITAAQKQTQAINQSVDGLVALYQSSSQFNQALNDIDLLENLSPEERVSRRVSAQSEAGNTAGQEAMKSLQELSSIARDSGKALNSLDAKDFEDQAGVQQLLKVNQEKLAAATEQAAKQAAEARKTLSEAAKVEITGDKSFDEIMADPSSRFAVALAQSESAIRQEAQIRAAQAAAQSALLESQAKAALASDDEDLFKKLMQAADESAAAGAKITQRAEKQITDQRKGYRDLTESQQKAKQEMEATAAATEALRQSMARTAAFMNSLVDARANLNEFKSALGDLTAVTENTAMKFELPTIEGLDDPMRVGNRGRFNTQVDQVTSSLGPEAQSIGDELKFTSNILEKSRKALVGKSFPLGEKMKAEDVLNRLGITAQTLGGGEIGKKLFGEMQKKLKGVEGPITEDKFNEIFDPIIAVAKQRGADLKEMQDLQNQQLAAYGQYLNAIQSKFDQELKQRDQILAVEAKGASLRAKARGRELSLETKQGQRQQRAQVALSGVRNVRTGGGVQAGNVASLSSARKAAQAERERIRQIKANTKLTRNQASQLMKADQELINTIKKTGAELDRLADQSDRASEIMSQIDEERGKREAVTSMITDFVVGGAEERRQMLQSFAGLRNAIQTGTLQGQSPDQRASIVGILDKLANVEITGTQGLTGKEVKQELIFRDAIRMGLDPKVAKQLATATSKEEQLILALDRLTGQMRAAVKAKGVAGLATGGLVQYRAGGGTIFKPRGTDTVPAMLTPGEFVVRKSAVDKIGAGNLQALNQNQGGVVYRQGGGPIGAGNQFVGGNVNIMTGAQYRAMFKEALQALGKDNFIGVLRKFGAGRGTLGNLTTVINSGTFDSGKLIMGRATEQALDKLRDSSHIFESADAFGATIKRPDHRRIPLQAQVASEAGERAINTRIADNTKHERELYTTSRNLQTNWRSITQDKNDFAANAIIKLNNGPDTLEALEHLMVKLDDLALQYRLVNTNMDSGRKIQQARKKARRGEWGSYKPKSVAQLIAESRGGHNLVRGVEGARPKNLQQRKQDKIRANVERARQQLIDEGILRMAHGGAVPGQDSIPAMLTPGEFVMNPQAVRKHGVGFMKNLNQGRIPGFRRGGLVATGNVQYRSNGSSGSEAKTVYRQGDTGVMSLDPTRVQGVLNEFNSQLNSNLTQIISTFSKFNTNITDLISNMQNMTWTHWHEGEMTLALNIANAEGLSTMLGEAIQEKMITLIDKKLDGLKKDMDTKAG